MTDNRIIEPAESAGKSDRPDVAPLIDSNGRPLKGSASAGPGDDDPRLAPPKIIKPGRGAVFIMLCVALVGVLLILWAWQLPPFRSVIVTTENSYVRGQITVLAPQVNGYVAEVMVGDFDHVKKGQPLIRIDDRTYRQQLGQALGQLKLATANLANSEQTAGQNDATLEQRRADIYAAQAEQNRAHVDQGRVDELAARGSVAQREADQIRATAREADANVYKAKAALTSAVQARKATTVSRGGLQAQVESAQAQVEQAQLNLRFTIIRAPRDGQLSEASVRPGQYVTAGSQLMFLVPDVLWVIANFKETQTARIRPGQSATFAVDALEGEKLRGHVIGFAPATGSEFSVLRPDNASGNFTKVVQRIPVRIAIDPGQSLARKLRPGMSVITRVDTSGAVGVGSVR